MNAGAYLRRIGCETAPAPTLEALRELARRHAMTIPFENLGVLANGAPDLDPAAIEAKLVERRRGGYCYEHNALLLSALRSIGFDVTPLSARVRYGLPPGTPTTPRSHMVLCVTLPEGLMLVDAGFGGLTLTAPVHIDTREPQATPLELVRIVAEPDGFMLQAKLSEAWQDLYFFDLVQQHPVDYLQQNWYTATRPGALFANNLVVAMPSRDGRRILFNRTLTWRPRDGAAEQASLASVDELRDALDRHFALRPDDAELAKAWAVSERGLAHHAMLV